MSIDLLNSEHISFDEMSEYVFSKKAPAEFMSVAARINKHVMDCPACRKNYEALMTMKDETEKAVGFESFDEKINTRIFAFLYSLEQSKPVKAVVDECLKFEKWLSFTIKNAREIMEPQTAGFSHPKLATVMKSATPGQDVEETETEIKSSLFDRKRNRVSIGLDGTLSLYFDESEHAEGKRVIILPDDPDMSPQMFELTRYDASISYVRFEGIAPGQYTVVVEETSYEKSTIN